LLPTTLSQSISLYVLAVEYFFFLSIALLGM
jgi:hypothetical protein